MKLFGTTKNKGENGKNGKNVLHLEITEVDLVHCNIVNNNYQHDSRDLYPFVLNNHLVNYQTSHQNPSSL